MRKKNIAVISEVGLPEKTPTGGVLRSVRSLKEYSKHFNIYFIITPMQSIGPEIREYLYREVGVKEVVELESRYLFKNIINNPRLRLGFIYPLMPRGSCLLFKGLDRLQREIRGVVVLNEPLYYLKIGQIIKEKLHIPAVALLQSPLMYCDEKRRKEIQRAYSLWYKELYAGEKIGKAIREWRTRIEFSVTHSRFVKNMLSNYDALIAVSRSIPLEMGEGFSSKFYVLDPGISLSSEDIELIGRVKRSTKSLKENYVVMWGRIDALKGFIEGVYAFRELLRVSPGLKLIATGHVSEVLRARINRFLRRLGVEERVVLTGAVPRSQGFEIVARAKLMLYPSHADSFSYAVLESLHLGTPVVAYDIPALKIYYADCPGVVLVKEGDLDALVAKAIEVMNTKDMEVKPPSLPSWDEILSEEVSIIDKIIT